MGVLARREGTHRGLPAKEWARIAGNHKKLEGAGRILPQNLRGENGFAHTSISDFRPQGWETRFVNPG